ncbi:hypothetical protein [Actinomadura geliboluensis]|uniref:Uncharacterized protein n=1 Tax=Actinomadura geliboluensis TaxID=882440 RepID=A0A5S4G2W4_9ACTN|nr:hypothetical protein [Actinomadura geliboluensis]TMR27355.1 hypothetical protein ETD96_39545 [Actinomadura geliboluensis]
MYSNGRPVIRLSSLPPNLVSMSDRGGCTLVGCPDCGAWRSVKRSMITPHRGPDVPGADAWPNEFRPPAPWCPGSGQKVRVDLTFEEWRARLEEGCRQSGQRRRTRVMPRPKPPVARAVVQIAAR